MSHACRDCAHKHLSRRGFLGAAGGGFLGFAAAKQADLFGAPALDFLLPQEGATRAAAKACIVVWLAGGPSHIDTFDPKEGRDTGGPVKAIKTAVDDITENPPEELPSWHASEIETSLMLAIDRAMVDWSLAKAEYPTTPKAVAGSKFVQDAGFSKTIKFAGYQVLLQQENSDYSKTSTVGNPERATAEKGERMLERFVSIATDLCHELKKLDVTPHTTAFPDRI